MGVIEAGRVLANVPTLLRLKRALAPRPGEERDCLGAQVTRNAARLGARPALLFDGGQWTWAEFNSRANRYAAAFKAQGIGHGDVVALFMENRPEFLAVLVALSKLGAVAGLINTNLRERPLRHCVSSTGSRAMVFGAELTDALAGIRDDLPLRDGEDYWCVADGDDGPPCPNWARDLDAASHMHGDGDPPETGRVRIADPVTYIFTSGTTGLPKAAVVSNRRFLAGAVMSQQAGLRCTPRDRLYLCLPLYHGTGLIVGIGAAISSGASTYLRRRFSASKFLEEVRRYDTNCLVYIGELCRYLMNTEARPDDHRNPLERIIGNGLRPDIWRDFKARFGIRRITEFYAASEGNVSFANLLNKDCTIGMTTARIALVRYDVDGDEIARDAAGRCVEVAPGEPGLLLGQINEEAVFEGYTSVEATEQKIVRDALEPGDAWFNSGDLLRQVDVGFALGFPHYQFVDRTGDTFRWKSENVSTNEVGEILNGFGQVAQSNVFGVAVPGADGRAGMAAVLLAEGCAELDLDAFSDYVCAQLPVYARPVFLRVQREMAVTGTFKLVKTELRDAGYDPARVEDPLYVLKPGASRYEPLDDEYFARLQSGQAGF